MNVISLLCAGAACVREGAQARMCDAGRHLCRHCAETLANDIGALSVLYAECEQLLLGPERSGVRTSGGSMPGMPFNASAADVRRAILVLLGSWAGLIAEGRLVPPPERTVTALSAFLRRHVAWLASHDAVTDASAEFDRLVRWALRVAHPADVRRVPIGRCVEAGCPGRLTAVVRPDAPMSEAEIVCATAAEHRWAAHEWTKLGRTMTVTGSLPPERAVRWLTAPDIARLWQVAPGSVYRLASERRWRRQARRGRTYYHEDDVAEAFSR
jgi:hypothetical protein